MTISARYAAALLAGSHQIATRAEVWSAGVLRATFSIEASSKVSVSRRATNRRTCSLVLTNGTAIAPDGVTQLPMVPAVATDLFTPYGNEVRVYKGITYTDGTTELVQEGVFVVTRLQIDDTSSDLVISLEGADRSYLIQKGSFYGDGQVPGAGGPTGDAIYALLQADVAVPSIGQWTFAFSQDTVAAMPLTPVPYRVGDDAWKLMVDLAAAAGYDLFFDATGALTYRPVLNPQVAPLAWSYLEGDGNLATEMQRIVDRAGGDNYIICDGQGSSVAPPVQGVAFDSDPSSPTYYLGPYGRQVVRMSSSLYTSQAQAQAAAQAALYLALGSIESVKIRAIPKPDHDVDDVIQVTRGRLNLQSKYYVLDGFDMGFGPSETLNLTAGRQVHWTGS